MLVLASGCVIDGGTDEATDTSADTDTSAECTWPIGDQVDQGSPQAITIVNTGAEPRFLIPNTCRATTLVFTRGGEELDDETVQACSDLRNDPDNVWCGDPCDGSLLAPAVRVEPGASYEFAWDGHAWRYTNVDQVCLDEIGACFSGCYEGQAIAPGTALGVRAQSAACNPENPQACECELVEGACSFDVLGDSSTFTDAFAIQANFVSGEPVVLDLAP